MYAVQSKIRKPVYDAPVCAFIIQFVFVVCTINKPWRQMFPLGGKCCAFYWKIFGTSVFHLVCIVGWIKMAAILRIVITFDILSFLVKEIGSVIGIKCILISKLEGALNWNLLRATFVFGKNLRFDFMNFDRISLFFSFIYIMSFDYFGKDTI